MALKITPNPYHSCYNWGMKSLSRSSRSSGHRPCPSTSCPNRPHSSWAVFFRSFSCTFLFLAFLVAVIALLTGVNQYRWNPPQSINMVTASAATEPIDWDKQKEKVEEVDSTAEPYWQRGLIEYYVLYEQDKAGQLLYSELREAAKSNHQFNLEDPTTYLGGYRLVAEEWGNNATAYGDAVNYVILDYPMLSMWGNSGKRTLTVNSNSYYCINWQDTLTEPQPLDQRYAATEEAAQNLLTRALGREESRDQLSDRKKVQQLFLELASTIVYDEAHELHDNDIYGALVLGKSRCAGMAAAFKYLLDKEGIPNFIANGTDTDITTGVNRHAMNVVLIDNQWLVCDLTLGSASMHGRGTTTFGLLLDHTSYYDVSAVVLDEPCWELEEYYMPGSTATLSTEVTTLPAAAVPVTPRL